ncbi:MAG: type IV secretory system conjugative DNA transfer family protein [Gammaproteobacteria bacterium]|nr:type IV secretory system conjugative DNA transfer family protein [Gammaproteobacteria bacterium]
MKKKLKPLKKLIHIMVTTYWSLFLGLAVIVFFLKGWSVFTGLALGLQGTRGLFDIFTMIAAGAYLASFIVALYLIAPIAALFLYSLGGEYRVASQYLFWNWAGTLIAASFALFCFEAWESINISFYPWNAMDLFYELQPPSKLYTHWMICFIGAELAILLFNFVGKIGLAKKMREALGNAHFASSMDIKKAKLFGNEGIVAGLAHGKILRVPGFESILLTAATGSGKTASIAIPNLIEHEGSAIINDLKGELYHLTARYRKVHDNNECYFFNPMDDNTQDFYNPFFYVSDHPEKRVDDVMIIAEALIPETKRGERFWYQSSRELFILLSLFLLETQGSATLAEIHDLSKKQDLQDFLTEGIAVCIQKYYTKMEEVHKNIEGIEITYSMKMMKQNAASFSAAHDKTRQNVLMDFHSRMTALMSHSIRSATSKNTFDLRDLRRKKMSIYIHIPASSKKLLSPILTIFWAQVTHLLTKKEPDTHEEPHSVLCLLDEFGMIDKIDRIRESLSFLRSYRLRFLIMVQYLNQIISTYGREDADSFFNNCKTKIYFTATDFEDAKRISQSLGQKTAKIQSQSINTGSFNSVGHVTTNHNYQSVPLLRPEELMKMSEKQSIIAVAGHAPIKAKKLYWFKHYKYKNKLGR